MTARTRVCDECWMYGGAHAAWCQSRGYAAIGPHPDAPPAETQRAPAGPVEECPCGRARAGCTYHDPKLQPEATPRTIEYEVSDVRVFFGQTELRCSEAVPKGAMVVSVSGHRGVFRIK